MRLRSEELVYARSWLYPSRIYFRIHDPSTSAQHFKPAAPRCAPTRWASYSNTFYTHVRCVFRPHHMLAADHEARPISQTFSAHCSPFLHPTCSPPHQLVRRRPSRHTVDMPLNYKTAAYGLGRSLRDRAMFPILDHICALL